MTMTTDMTPATTFTPADTDGAETAFAADSGGFDLQFMENAMLDAAWLTILHPQTFESTPIKIKLAGADSDSYKKIERRVRNRNVALLKKNKNGLSAEVVEASALDLLTGATLDWQGVTWGGAPLEFSQENARMLYEKFGFIRDQVDEFVGDRANFFSS